MYEQYTSRQLYPIWDKNHIPLQAIPLKTVFANFPNEAAAFFYMVAGHDIKTNKSFWPFYYCLHYTFYLLHSCCCVILLDRTWECPSYKWSF